MRYLHMTFHALLALLPCLLFTEPWNRYFMNALFADLSATPNRSYFLYEKEGEWLCCDRKSRAICAQSFAPWQQTTIKIMIAISLTVACSRYVFNGVILHAYPVRGESHNQRNTTGEVATTDYHMQMRWLKRNENNIFQQSKTILKLKHGLSGGPVFTSSFSLPPSSFATVWQWLLIFHANF